MQKRKYQEEFNWMGEIHIFYKQATTYEKALTLGIRALAKKVGYSNKYVRDRILDYSGKYEVKEVKPIDLPLL